MFTEVSKSDVAVLRAFLDVVSDVLDHVEQVGEIELDVEYLDED